MRSACLLAMIGASLLASETWAAPGVGGAPAVPVGTTTASLSFQERLSQPISADFKEVDFASAIDFLSESAGVNVIVSDKAKTAGRPVTVRLVEMPLLHALEYLLRGQGLLFRMDQESIWVATRDEIEAEPLETRVYFLNQGPGLFATFEPLAETRESVALKADRKSTRLNSSHSDRSRMPSSA